MAVVTMSHAQSEMPSMPECPDSENIFTWISDTAKFAAKYGAAAVEYINCMRKSADISCVTEWIKFLLGFGERPICYPHSHAKCVFYLG